MKTLPQQMALANKIIAKHEKFSSLLHDITFDTYGMKMSVQFERQLLCKLVSSKKWKYKISDSGFIWIERKFQGKDIFILLW